VTNGNNAKSALISLYTPGTSNLINSTNVTGLGSISYSNSTADFNINHDSSKMTILLKSLYLDNITTTSNIILDSISPSIPNVTLRRAYKISVPSSFSFTGITLSIKYSDLQVNEDSLYLYRCGNYDLVNNTCNENWIKISMTKDTGNDIVTAELTGFSAYALGEGQDQSTTTTTTTTTVQSSSSSGSTDSGGYSGGSGGGGGGFPTTTVPTTTTLAHATTTVPPTTTTIEQTNENVKPNQQSQSIFTGLAPLVYSNGILIGLPLVTAAAVFISWKFYLKNRFMIPHFPHRNHKVKLRRVKRGKETRLILQ
jgi:hypothetical protein